MGRKRYYHSILIMAVFAMIIAVSAVCAMAESSVDITQPDDGSTVKPGYVEVWTRFAQPPGMGNLAITEGRASSIKSQFGVQYTPVHYKVYKDNTLIEETDVNQEWLNFTTTGSKSTRFLFEDEGTYTISASTPRTSDEWDSVTINVKGEYNGVDYSGKSYDFQNADTITEGKPVRCTLTPGNDFMTAYRLTPSKSGWYVFFSSGYMKNIRATLYEGDGEEGGHKRVTYGYDNDGKCGFSAELTEGTTYTLLIEGYVKKTDTVFDIGFFNKESTLLMASASEIVLTDPNCSYNFGVCSGSEFAESSYWVIQDDSIVGSDGSSTFSRGTTEYPSYYNGMTIKLNARKNGTTTVSLINGATKEAYASCKVICKDIAENDSSDSQDGGEAPEDTSEPEYSTDNPGYYINPEKDEYNAQKGQVVTIKFDMSCDAEALGSGSRFLYYADHVPKSSQKIIKYKALGPYEFTESNSKLVADGYIEYDCLAAGTGQLYVYMLVNGTRYDKHVITINVSDPSSNKGEDNTPDDSSGQNQGGQTPDNQQGGGQQDGGQQKPDGNTPSSEPSKETGTDGTALGKGAAFEAAEAAIAGMKSDADPKGSVFNKLKLNSTKQTKSSITLKWTKNSKAVKYIIYGNKCGKTIKPKKLAAVEGKNTKTITKVAGKKLKKGKYYKFIIVAIDKNNKVVSTSKLIHVATKGGKVGNVKSVSIKKSVLTKAKNLKKGKSMKLNAKAVAQSKTLTVKKHASIRYESSNKKIVTVTRKGVVKAKKKGTCYIYAYAQNGVFKKIKIVVK